MKSHIQKPVIILGCPRSGTTLLFTILGQSKQLYSLYNESRFIFKEFYREQFKKGIEYYDDALSDSVLDTSTRDYFLNQFHKYSFHDRIIGLALQKVFRKHLVLKPFTSLVTQLNSFYKDLFVPNYRIVEKTPRNCFKIAFMNKLFPDAKFIYIKRDGRSNISSLFEGWKKRRGKGGKERFPKLRSKLNIKGYDGTRWHFALPPNWEEFASKELIEACAFQWVSSNQAIVDGLKDIPKDRKCEIFYEDLSDNTASVVKNICQFADIPYSSEVGKIANRPPVVNTFSTPSKDKWKRHTNELEKIYPMIEPMMHTLGYNLRSDKQAVIKGT